MHILILPSWYPLHPSDVQGVFFRDQALALNTYGHKIGVIAVQARSIHTLFSIWGKFRDFEIDNNLATYRTRFWDIFPGVPFARFWQFRYFLNRCFDSYVREHGMPDIIHAHSVLYAGAAAVDLGRSHRIPVVLTEHSSGFARNLFRPWQIRLASAAAAAAEFRIAVSPALGKLLHRELGSAWEWVPNVVGKRFENWSIHENRGLGRSLRILNIGVMNKNKGQLNLLKAFSLVHKELKNTELWFAGDGPLRTELERMSASFRLDGRVKFLGMIEPDNIPQLLANADVVVVASRYETFSVVAAEALIMGKPVVATRCGGPECIVGADDGLLVDPEIPDSLGAALVQIVRNLEHYSSANIARRARLRFGTNEVARQLTEIYETLVVRYKTGI